jgi:hypothetical protein
MGFFDKVKRVVDPLDAKNLLKGKEQVNRKDALANDINASAKTGMGYMNSGASSLNALYNEDPSQIVNSQIGMENKLARGAADDATRRTQQLIAQRGMGTSSIGLGQEVNNRKNLMDRLSMNTASGISRLRDMRLSNAQGQMNVGQALYGLKTQQGPIQMQTTKYRTGGLAGLAGAAIGGYMGGAQGAQVGAGIGQMYQNS